MIKEYFFQGGMEIAKVKVDYRDRTILICSRMTANAYKPLHKVLSHKKSLFFYEYISFMDDKQFEDYLINEFKKMGYSLALKKEVK